MKLNFHSLKNHFCKLLLLNQIEEHGVNTPAKESWASACKNNEFYYIETYSGYASTRGDPKGKQHLLNLEASDEALGTALLDALAHSRCVLPAEDPELFDYELSAKRYKAWIAEISKKYGYKTKRAMFKDMQSCNITKVEGSITIRPSKHETLEGWGGTGISKEDHVVLPDSSSAAEVGAALRLAFSRCK